jgi:murein DD-endopeptidase MepM/ murein hydrolase activator NlpD
MVRHRIDGLTLVAVAFLCFFLFNILQDRQSDSPDYAQGNPMSGSAVAASLQLEGKTGSQESPVVLAVGQETGFSGMDSEAIAAPYEHYAVTQGPHGQSYGQLAIDLSAGKGAAVLSPINGVVTQLYIDEWGDTTLVIENDHYIVTLLHGIYTVAIGDRLKLGQPVGQESNQGNTVDALGNSCRGRDCGYHTHINIFDKILGTNINPLELWQ